MDKLTKTEIVFEALTLIERELASFAFRLNCPDRSYKSSFMGIYNDLRRHCDDIRSQISLKDVYDECWSICRSIDDMPNVARFLQNRLDCAIKESKPILNVGRVTPERSEKILVILEIKHKSRYLNKKEYDQICDDFLTIYGFQQQWYHDIGNVINRFSQRPESEQNTDTTKEDHNQIFPNELDREDVKRWLNVAVENGFLDADYQPTERLKTKAQKALLADEIRQKTGLKEYRPFEQLWNETGLARQRYNSREYVGTVKGGEEIIKMFK